MKLNTKLYRAVTVPTEYFLQMAGADRDANARAVEKQFREEYGPFAPGFQIFWGSLGSQTIVGIEVLAGSDCEAQVPKSAIIHADPFNATDIARVDGALISELGRLLPGVVVEYEGIGWKWWYEVLGN